MLYYIIEYELKGVVFTMENLLLSLIMLMISLNLNIIYSNFKLLCEIDKIKENNKLD